MTNPIPEGYHSLTPSLMFKESKKAIEFYKKAFNAQLLDVFPSVDGNGIMHASLKIGNSIIMIGDEMDSPNCPKSAETTGQSPISLFFYVDDADRSFDQAVSAGAKASMAVMDMFWGDRVGQVQDPFGYSWMIATRTQDLTQEEITKRSKAFFASVAGK